MATAAEIQDALGGLSDETYTPPAEGAGQPRDPAGRFASFDTALDAPPAPPAPAPATPPAPTAADGVPPVTETAPATAEGQPAAETTSGVTEPPPVEITDWKFSTQRRGEPVEIVIPGAKYAKGHGVLVPDTPEAQTIFKQSMNRAALYPHVQAQLQDVRSQLQTGVTRQQVENVAMAEQLQRLLDPKFHAEALGIELAQLPPQYTVALERVQVALERKQAELERVAAPHMIQGADPASQDQVLVEQLNEVYDDILMRVAPELSAGDRQQLEQDIEGYAPAFVRRGRNGAEVLPEKMERYIQDWVKARVAASPPVTAQPGAVPPAPKPAVPVAARNAAAAQDKVAAPPSAGGAARNLAAPPPQKPKAGDGAFKSPDDVHAFFGR